jgi:hypothetical protein
MQFHLIDTGHFVLEDKADEVVPLIRDFLDRTMRRAGRGFGDSVLGKLDVDPEDFVWTLRLFPISTAPTSTA